jgi:hypothetical protein
MSPSWPAPGRALHQIRAQLAAHRQEITIIASPGSLAAAILELAPPRPGIAARPLTGGR